MPNLATRLNVLIPIAAALLHVRQFRCDHTLYVHTNAPRKTGRNTRINRCKTRCNCVNRLIVASHRRSAIFPRFVSVVALAVRSTIMHNARSGMISVFVSHSSRAIKRAVRFKELMQQGSCGVDVFLSSDWESIGSGAIWVQEIERALSCCKHFVALLTSVEDAHSPWMNYEIGYARGRGISPRIFLFDSITASEVPDPAGTLHLIPPGDTNRRVGVLHEMGVSDPANQFAKLLYVRSEDDVDATRTA